MMTRTVLEGFDAYLAARGLAPAHVRATLADLAGRLGHAL
jgi:hypothetical protein